MDVMSPGSRFFVGAAAFLSAAAWAGGSHAAAASRTIALSGQRAPDSFGLVFDSTQVLFGEFGAPRINNQGQVAFLASIDGPPIDQTNNQAIYSEGEGPLRQVIQKSLFASITELEPPVLNDAGDLMFLARLADSVPDRLTSPHALYVESNGFPTLVAREEGPAPGFDSQTRLHDFRAYAYTNSGDILFQSVLSGPSVDTSNAEALYAGQLNNISLVGLAEDLAPHPGPEAAFMTFRLADVNEAGTLAFIAELIAPFQPKGIYAGPPNAIREIALTGAASQATGPGTVFGMLPNPQLNERDQLAFHAETEEPGSPLRREAILLDEAGTLTLLALTGQPAPDLPGFVLHNIGASVEAFAFNDEGHVAFRASLRRPDQSLGTDQGVFSNHSGQLRLVAGTGMQVPVISPNDLIDGLGLPTVNNLGQIVFSGHFISPGSTIPRQALWAADTDGTLHLIAREGQLLDVNPDALLEDWRTVVSIGNLDHNGAHLNDRGELAYVLHFADGTEGLFVAAVPEPGGLAVLVLFGPAALRRW